MRTPARRVSERHGRARSERVRKLWLAVRTGFLPAARRASLISVSIPATVGAEAEVPPEPEQPPYVHSGMPNCARAARSGYPRPCSLNVSRLGLVLGAISSASLR